MVCKRNVLSQGVIFLGLLSMSLEDCTTEYEHLYICHGRQEDGTCSSGYYNNVNTRKCYSISHDLTKLKDWVGLHEQSLQIYNSDLYEIKPATFRYFSNLLRLYMPGNNITLLEPGSFSGLSNLEYLNLSYNNIPTVSKGVFNAMYKLVSLDLSHNNINTIDNTSFTGTDNLRNLYLNDNEILEVPSFTGDYQNLIFLDISNNAIEELEFIKICPRLKTLNVANNNISTFSADELSSSIINLDLSGNKIHYIESHDLKNLMNLQKLNLSCNPLFEVNDVPVDLFRYTRFLQVLNLSSTSIKKLSVGIFTQLQSLRVLDLSSNNLTYLPNGIFHDLLKLTQLYINNNLLSYFENDGFSNLHKIDLSDNLWNCDSLSAIIKKFGSNTIIRGNAYNETNVYGVACYEDVKDFEKNDAYDSSDFNSLQKEYLAHIIRTQVDTRDIFAQLKVFLNETNANQRNQKSTQTEQLMKIVSILGSMQKTATTATVPEQGNQDSTKQLIQLQETIQQKSEIYMKQIIELQRNYSVDYWQKFELIQRDLRQTLSDIKDNLVATKTQSQTPTLFTPQAEAFKKYETFSTNKSDTVALYCIFFLLLAIFGFMVLLQFRKYKILKRNHEGNPLNALEI